MAERKVSVRVNLDALLGSLQNSIQKTTNLVSFGLLASEKAMPQALVLPHTQFHVALGGSAPADFEATRGEFNTWALTGGLRDCVEAVGVFMEEARRVCAVWSLVGRDDVRGADWDRRIVAEARKYHRFGMPDKIRFLQEEYDRSLYAELSDSVLSINRSRNCLVHRRGIVSDLDVNSPGGMTVSWLKPELIVRGPGDERVLKLPERVERGEELVFRQTETAKSFALGDRVVFSSQEFGELCWTLFRFGQQLKDAVVALGKAKGITFREPDTDDKKP